MPPAERDEMPTIKDVLAWADEVCDQAITEARAGDASLANRIGANSSLKLYFDNVHRTKAVPATAFPAYYAGHFKEITRLYEDYQRDLEKDAQLAEVSTLRESLDALKALVEGQAAMLAEMKTAQKPADTKKTKPAKTEPEADAEADAESEA